jgi:hypothetical protein
MSFRILRCTTAALFMTLGMAVSASAQLAVSNADIQRLQDTLAQATTEVQQLRARDAGRAATLEPQLNDLRDEVTYLRVKLRREGTVARTDYADVRDRIDDLRSRASADAPAAAAVPAAAPPPAPAPATRPATRPGEIPVGTELDVRLQTALNSGTSMVEDRFEATTLVDVSQDGRTLIPAGSVMRGVVTSVEPATRTNRTARMTVSFDQVTVGGRAHPIRVTVTQAIEGEGIRGETTRAGAGAGIGAVIGGLLGGFKGAIAGILVGGGGAIAATEGRQVELPAGSVLRVRFDSPVTIDGGR